MDEYIVTPWEVSGEIDYDKLIKEFGTSKINEETKKKLKGICGDLHHMISREFFFSHRDLDLVLDDFINKRGFFLYTGRKPSKGMHIGHMVSMELTKWLQDKFKCNLYIEITDDEGYLSKKYSWDDVQNAAKENILDIIATGFDPDRTFIFKDSEYVKNVYPLLLRTSRKITNSTVKAVFGFNDSTNIGLSMYPAYQAIPTFFEKKRCLIPCGIDQDPYWRIQRDIAESMGFFKTAAFHSRFMPPLEGVNGKMSSSNNADSAIYLDDDEKTVKKKIGKYAFSGGKETIEEHRKHGGNPSIDVSYQWLKIMFEKNDQKLKKIHDDYVSGALLSGELKSILIDKVNDYLLEHRSRREKADIDKFMYSGKLSEKMWEKIHY